MGHASTAELLIDLGGAIDAEDKEGMTPLHWVFVFSPSTSHPFLARSSMYVSFLRIFSIGCETGTSGLCCFARAQGS